MPMPAGTWCFALRDADRRPSICWQDPGFLGSLFVLRRARHPEFNDICWQEVSNSSVFRFSMCSIKICPRWGTMPMSWGASYLWTSSCQSLYRKEFNPALYKYQRHLYTQTSQTMTKHHQVNHQASHDIITQGISAGLWKHIEILVCIACNFCSSTSNALLLQLYQSLSIWTVGDVLQRPQPRRSCGPDSCLAKGPCSPLWIYIYTQ